MFRVEFLEPMKNYSFEDALKMRRYLNYPGEVNAVRRSWLDRRKRKIGGEKGIWGIKPKWGLCHQEPSHVRSL